MPNQCLPSSPAYLYLQDYEDPVRISSFCIHFFWYKVPSSSLLCMCIHNLVMKHQIHFQLSLESRVLPECSSLQSQFQMTCKPAPFSDTNATINVLLEHYSIHRSNNYTCIWHVIGNFLEIYYTKHGFNVKYLSSWLPKPRSHLPTHHIMTVLRFSITQDKANTLPSNL